jgi:hypothetical protein
LQELAQRLDQQTATVVARQASLTQRLTDWEQEQIGAEAERTRLQVELQSLMVQRSRHERETQELREEVERLARLLMDDAPLPMAA